MSRTRRRFPVFYIVLLAFIVLFFAAFFYGLTLLKDWLADYEASLPKYAAEAVFEQYYQSEDKSALLRGAGFETSPYESEGDALQKLSEAIDGQPLSYTSVSTGLDGREKYNVKAGEKKISSFTLAKSGRTSKYGHDLYALESLEVFVKKDQSASVMVPDGYTLTFNGKEADTSLIKEKDIPTPSCEHMPEGVKGLTYSLYEITDLLYAPQVKVISPDGRECEMGIDEQRDVPKAAIVYDDALQREMSEHVLTAAKAYAAFMQMDGNRNKVLSYFEKGTPLYDGISTVEYYFVIPHSSYDFEDVKCGEFFRYDDNTFSCRVSFVHVLKKPGMEDFRDFIDITFYLRRVGDQYLIYDRYNNN